jgi:hypothetical protein
MGTVPILRSLRSKMGLSPSAFGFVRWLLALSPLDHGLQHQAVDGVEPEQCNGTPLVGITGSGGLAPLRFSLALATIERAGP